jgi:hypothetical protein
MGRFAVASIIAALLLLAGCNSAMDPEPEAPDAENSDDANADLPTVVQGTAEEVQRGFADNGDFGQEQNIQHPVLVTGTIGAVKKNIDDERYVTFGISGRAIGPVVMFSKSKRPTADRLFVGKKIKVLCPSIHLVDDSVVLEDCVLQ